MNQVSDNQIDHALEEALVSEFMNPDSGAISESQPASPARKGKTVVRTPTPAPEDPIFLGPEANHLKRSTAEHQLRAHIGQLGWFDRYIVCAAMRGAHRKAAIELTDALVRVSVDMAKLKLTMGSQIIRAELLIEFLKTQPRLASEVSRLCHETRVALTDQLFKLSDEMYALRNSRMAQISEHQSNGFFTSDDADEQRELLKRIVAEELTDKWTRYAMVFRNVSQHFVRTLTTALEHVQNAAVITAA